VVERMVVLPGFDDQHWWLVSEVAACGGSALQSDADISSPTSVDDDQQILLSDE
jgi:hypothetical protein